MQEFIDALSNPSMRHAIAVHMPIALSQLGLPLILLTAFLQRDRHTLRTLALLVYLLLAATAFAAVLTGRLAMEALPPTQSAEVAGRVQKHEDLAAAVTWLAGATALCLFLTYFPVPKLRLAGILLALAAGFLTAAWVGITAHQGGMLVYEHGAGTPMMKRWAQAPPTAETDPADEASDRDNRDFLEDGAAMPIRPIDMDEAAAVSYLREVVPILEIYCIDCHEGRRPDGEFDMTTVDKLLGPGKQFEQNFIPGQPDASPAIQYIRGILQPQMPKGEDPIPEEDLHTLRLWIAAGCIDDSQTVSE